MNEFSKKELDEMEIIANTFEKKLESFESDVSYENSVQLILKGHLYIEHELRELLRKNIKNPSALDIDKLKYVQLSKLIFALDLLPFVLFGTTMKINNLRNRCSHNLKYNFGIQEYRELEETFSDSFKKQYLGFLESVKEPLNELIKLQMSLFTLWEIVSSLNDIPAHIREKLS